MTISVLSKDDFHVAKDGKIYFTYSDLAKLPEWPNSPQLELFNGELFMPPSPTIFHQEISDNLLFHIKQYLMTNKLGKILSAPVDVLLSEKDVVIPDLIFIAKNNSEIIKEKNIRGVPNLIIEILSSNRENDEIRKLQLYEEYEVIEYWIVYPDEKLITKYLFDEENKKFSKGEIFNFSDKIYSKVIRGFRIELELVFKKE